MTDMRVEIPVMVTLRAKSALNKEHHPAFRLNHHHHCERVVSKIVHTQKGGIKLQKKIGRIAKQNGRYNEREVQRTFGSKGKLVQLGQLSIY